MNSLLQEQNLIRLTGIIGIVGALLLMVADLLLLATPVSGQDFFDVGNDGWSNVAGMDAWRIELGLRMNMLLPLYIVGLWQVYQALRPAPIYFPLPVFLLFSYTVVAQMTVRTGYIFLGRSFGTQADMSESSYSAIIQLINDFGQYVYLIEYMTITVYVFGCILFIAVVATLTTHYPQWMALLTPALTMAVIDMIARLSPAPIGGYLAPVRFNLAFLLLFVTSTIILWNKPTQGGTLAPLSPEEAYANQ